MSKELAFLTITDELVSKLSLRIKNDVSHLWFFLRIADELVLTYPITLKNTESYHKVSLPCTFFSTKMTINMNVSLLTTKGRQINQ